MIIILLLFYLRLIITFIYTTFLYLNIKTKPKYRTFWLKFVIKKQIVNQKNY